MSDQSKSVFDIQQMINDKFAISKSFMREISFLIEKLEQAGESDIAKLYDKAALKEWGDDAFLNFPELKNEYKKELEL
jgi:hypothetical protein